MSPKCHYQGSLKCHLKVTSVSLSRWHTRSCPAIGGRGAVKLTIIIILLMTTILIITMTVTLTITMTIAMTITLIISIDTTLIITMTIALIISIIITCPAIGGRGEVKLMSSLLQTLSIPPPALTVVIMGIMMEGDDDVHGGRII